MNPGRKLDGLVAEKVMGWGCYNDGYLNRYYPPGPPDLNIVGREVPPYSTSIEAAWEVVERLKQNNRWLRLEGNAANGHGALFWGPSFTTDWVTADAAPLAICLAALKAVGA